MDSNGSFAELTIEHNNLPNFTFTTIWFPFGNLAWSNPNEIPFVVLILYTSDYVDHPFAGTFLPLVLVPHWIPIHNGFIVCAVVYDDHLHVYFGPGIYHFQHNFHTRHYHNSH
jgi:hypothetical protein